MAGDPARARKITDAEVRREAQAACRKIPCLPVMYLFREKKVSRRIPCCVCVHEGEIRKILV